MKTLSSKFSGTHALGMPEGRASLQHGLSLIELMISITIGLLILASLSTLFANQSRTRAELDKSNRMIDNGRFALDTLSGDLRMAGYYGEFEPETNKPPIPATLPNPCSTVPADIAAALQFAVQGYDAADSTSSITSLPSCGFTYSPGSDRSLKPGSDILVIRRASTAEEDRRVPDAALDGVHYIQTRLCRYDPVDPAFILSTSKSSFTLRTNACKPGSAGPYADVREMKVHVYYVSPDNNISPRDGIPTLKRLELDEVTHNFEVRPLVEGVDHLQIEYGMDTSGDGIADSYVTAPADTAWANVVAVKAYILARNNESTSGHTDTKTYSLGQAGTVTPGDAYKRHAYSQFIRLINPAGRRE